MTALATKTDRLPIITPAIRQRAYAKLLATAIYSDDEHKRQAAANAIKLLFELRERCKERKSA